MNTTFHCLIQPIFSGSLITSLFLSYSDITSILLLLSFCLTLFSFYLILIFICIVLIMVLSFFIYICFVLFNVLSYSIFIPSYSCFHFILLLLPILSRCDLIELFEHPVKMLHIIVSYHFCNLIDFKAGIF